MKPEIKARYRNKLSKVIIEVWNGEKWIYVKTLSNPLKEFEQECLAKVSFSKGENSQNDDKKFAYSILTESLNKDTINEITQQDIEKAKQNINNLMGEILGSNKKVTP